MAKKQLTQQEQWVASVIAKAREAAGTPEALALALQREGLTSGKKPTAAFSAQAVNNWARGDFLPAADVLLAAAKIGEVKIDAIVYGESLVGKVDRLETLVLELLAEVRREQ